MKSIPCIRIHCPSSEFALGKLVLDVDKGVFKRKILLLKEWFSYQSDVFHISKFCLLRGLIIDCQNIYFGWIFIFEESLQMRWTSREAKDLSILGFDFQDWASWKTSFRWFLYNANVANVKKWRGVRKKYRRMKNVVLSVLNLLEESDKGLYQMFTSPW
jgi:hypothetical protein